jgi:hypothetical protein
MPVKAGLSRQFRHSPLAKRKTAGLSPRRLGRPVPEGITGTT